MCTSTILSSVDRILENFAVILLQNLRDKKKIVAKKIVSQIRTGHRKSWDITRCKGTHIITIHNKYLAKKFMSHTE